MPFSGLLLNSLLKDLAMIELGIYIYLTIACFVFMFGLAEVTWGPIIDSMSSLVTHQPPTKTNPIKKLFYWFMISITWPLSIPYLYFKYEA